MPQPPDRSAPASPLRRDDVWIKAKAAAPKNAAQLYVHQNSKGPFFFQGTCYLSQLRQEDETFQAYVNEECFKPDGLLGVVIMGGEDGARKVLVYNKSKQKVMQSFLKAATQVHLSVSAANAMTLLDENDTHWGLRLVSDEHQIKFCTEVMMARCAAWVEEDQALIWQDIAQGSGPACVPRDTVALRYTGWLEGPDGKASIGEQFDTNEDDDSDPLLLILGEGRGIWALEEGVVGMKEGGTRRLVVRAALGSSGQIGWTDKASPTSVLHFCVTLIGLVSGKEEDGPWTPQRKAGNQIIGSFAGTHMGMMGVSSRTMGSQALSSSMTGNETKIDADDASAGRDEDTPQNNAREESKFRFAYAGTGKLYKRTADGLQLVQAGGYDTEGTLGVVVVTGEDGAKNMLVFAPVLQAEIRAADDMKPTDDDKDTAFDLNDDSGTSWSFRLHNEEHRTDLLSQLRGVQQSQGSDGSDRSNGGGLMSQEDINSPTPSITNRPPPPEKPAALV